MGSAPLITLIFRPYFARQINYRGSKLFIIIGLFATLIGTMAYPYLSGFGGLIAARMVQGSGLILFFFSSLIMVSRIIPQERRGELFGIYSIVFIFPLLFAPIMGSKILENFSFRYLTLTAAILLLIAILLSLKLKEIVSSPPQEESNNSKVRRQEISAPILVVFFLIFANAGIFTFLPLAAQKFQIANWTLFFSLFAFASITTRVIFGKTFDRYPRRNFIIAGVIIIITAVMIFSRFNFVSLLMAAFIYGVGVAISDSNLLPYIIGKFEKHSLYKAITIYSITFDLAYLLAPPVIGLMVEKMSYPAAFIIVACLIFAAGVNFCFSKSNNRI